MKPAAYELIVTLGPASRTPQMWGAMMAAGATGFRLNTSHLSLDELDAWLEELDLFLMKEPMGVTVTLDLQGSKWRLGSFTPFMLEPGALVTLTCAAQAGEGAFLPVPHADFFRALGLSSGEVILNDAKSRLMIESSGDDWAAGRVVLGGEIMPRKGITLAQTEYRVESMSEKDKRIVARTRAQDTIRYAVSYVRDAVEMERYRELVGGDCFLAAKLERQPAVEQALAVAQWADALWVCRGDLGAELGLTGMAQAVSEVTACLPAIGKPVLMAGQVLEHMTAHATPTRSEVCYLHDALAAGYAGVVLSDETAIGAYPVEAVQVAGMWRGED